MAEMGRDSGELRLPMYPLNDSELSALRETLSNYGIGVKIAV